MLFPKAVIATCVKHCIVVVLRILVNCYDLVPLLQISPGVQLEGGLGEIGAEILPCIGLKEKWKSP